ncbi:MAG: PD-(D/E)XK nuclease domain-containing protein, partial [Bacteroidales bacterium]|nr:PD-(D/E)XK nuclease domain-containing protein [Bacteroidales bacterium]
PNTEYEWVCELKYINEKDKGNSALIKNKKEEALAQINRYKESAIFKDRTDMRYLIVMFLGGTQFEIYEVN